MGLTKEKNSPQTDETPWVPQNVTSRRRVSQGMIFLSPAHVHFAIPPPTRSMGSLLSPPQRVSKASCCQCARSSHPSRRKGLHASSVGLVYTEKANLLKEGDVCTKWSHLPFLKHIVTLGGCQILQLLHGAHVVKLLIMFSICLHLILIKSRLRGWREN